VCVVVNVGQEKRAVGTGQRAGRVSLTQSHVTADDMQSALATALVSLASKAWFPLPELTAELTGDRFPLPINTG